MKLSILTFCFLIFTNKFYTQTLSGNASVFSSSESVIKYGNVEAYDKDNKLIRSTLTDEFGNYNIKFSDTGVYNIKIMYAGYDPIEETIHVTEDVLSDFKLKRDKSKKTRTLSKESYALSISSGYHRGSGVLDSKSRPGKSYVSPVVYKKTAYGKSKSEERGLTAGEINDFSKWNLWNDILESELKNHQINWKLNPQKRYVVQLLNNEKSPLVGAIVKLISKKNTVIWESVTDNTGKAELWGSIINEKHQIKKIAVTYKGKEKSINNPKTFKKGINTVVFESPCGTSYEIDIAFVVDATGSMSDEINFIKRDLNKVIYNSQKLYDDVSLRYGSVFYRDNRDAYVTKHKDFTNVLSEALVYIDEQTAGGGGDHPEAADSALDVAINKLSWNSNARAKLLFLILDAPPHSTSANLDKIEKLSRMAAKKGIKIIPVAGSGINKSTEYLMRAMALSTNGKYVFLTNHSGIGNSHIKPSTDEYSVELLSTRLTNIIKNNIYYPKCDEEIPNLALNYPDSSVQFPLPIKDTSANDSITTTDIKDTNTIEKIKWNFYPNPTSDMVTIEVSKNVDFIFLTDISGKILQKIGFSDTKKKTVQLGDYPTGIYLLRYPMGKQWITGKLILTR